MTRSVLRAKIEFFDVNPLGRILNRFSADVGINDDLLPQTLHDFLGCAFIVLGGVATAFSVLPITLVAFPPLLWYFVSVRNSFLKISRELKRLEGLARSPMFDMLSESLNGIITIRSNNATQHFQRQFQLRHDAHSRLVYSLTL
jgi:ATP-binding cassette subfamily C (CFTR/MRP) protein 4